MEAARNSSSDEGPIIARPMQRIQGEGVSPRSSSSSSSSSSSDSETEIVDLVLGQVLEERRLSVVEEVSSGGEDPNAPASDTAGVVRAKPILAMMHSLTSSSSSDGHETVVIAESTMPGIVHVANCTIEGGSRCDIEVLFISF